MQRRDPDRSGFVTLGRVRLRVWEWGDEDAPAVICVHGAHDHGRMFDGLGPALARMGYRVVAPDVRGHGDSDRISSGHLWHMAALDLCLLARHLGPPVGMVGHSFGGGQAMFTAGVWPELVRWVVNLDGLGPPEGDFGGFDLAEGCANSLAAIERVLFSAPRLYPSLEDMVERRRRVNTRLPEDWVRHLVRHGARQVEGGFAWKTDPMFNVGLPDDFGPEYLEAENSMISCPLLVLTGSEPDTWSELTPEQVERRLAPLRTARHRVVAEAGHYVHIEQPESVLDAIAGFVAEVGA
ncbi:MAG TPA: alpha/beta hydrolase [Acidimicrobiales bacterium]|nr:alpha/beta hydrolase [Acidimicrobiales bacterium]